jgi:hypothetical protein
MIRETTLANRQAVEGLREQLISYRERINYLEKRKSIQPGQTRIFRSPG